MNFNKKLTVAVSGAVLLMAGQFALADSTTDIVDALVSKGVLTEEEGKLITKGHTSQKEKTPTIKEKDGAFSLSSPNGKNSIQLTGRLHFDYRNNDTNNFGSDTSSYDYSRDPDSKSVGDHFEVRRARLGVKGRIGGIADYLLQGNIVGSRLMDEAWIDINKYEPLGFKFGQFKQPVGLEQLTSSNNIDFMERSYVDQLVPAKKMGAMLHGEVTGFTYAGSIFQPNDDAKSARDDKQSFAARGTVNFAELMGNKEAVMHLGISGWDQNYEVSPESSGNTSKAAESTTRSTIFSYRSGGRGLANAFRMQVGGEACGSADYHCLSPNSAKVKSDALGLEAIGAYGPVKLQAEYLSAYYKAYGYTDTISADTDAWYVEGLWMLTGEKYADAYKKGAFGLVKPKNDFDGEGKNWGAIELGLRMDAFTVDNTQNTGTSAVSRFQGAINTLSNGVDECKSVSGSCDKIKAGAKSYTAQLKWILNPNMLIKADYTHTKYDYAFNPIDLGASTARTTSLLKSISDEDLLMIRGQYMF